jgi:hypothetical protein
VSSETCSPGEGQLVSLSDGFYEQRCMTDTDLMSTATGSVAIVALLGNSKEIEDEEGSVGFCSATSGVNYPTDNDNNLSIELKKLTTIVKLAECEATDDLDLSPVED